MMMNIDDDDDGSFYINTRVYDSDGQRAVFAVCVSL